MFIRDSGRGGHGPGAELVATAQVAGREFILRFPLGSLEPARTADMEGVLRAQFEKTGDTQFELASFAAPGFPPLLIPPPRFKEIRREFYRLLAERVTGTRRAGRDEAKRRALASLAGTRAPARHQRAELIVRLEQVRDYHLLHQEGIDLLSFPVSRAAMHQLPTLVRKLRGREDRILWRLPFIIYEADIPFYREAAAYLAGEGFRRFEAANLGHFPLLREIEGNRVKSISRHRQGSGDANAGTDLKAAPLEISTDYRLFSLNSQALLAWQALGASAATLYIEDDADNMAELLAADLPIQRRVLVYGGVPVITTKIRIKDVKADAPLVSDRGDEYTTAVRDGLTVITPTTPFSLTGFRRRLQDMGCGSFVVDLSQLSQNDWPQVLDAFARGSALEGTSEFNFTMGLV
jgi:putative protease